MWFGNSGRSLAQVVCPWYMRRRCMGKAELLQAIIAGRDGLKIEEVFWSICLVRVFMGRAFQASSAYCCGWQWPCEVSLG